MIFLSYASEDRPKAEVLVAKLQSRGLPVWWDVAMPPGEVIEKQIETALRRCQLAVVLWSQHFEKKTWPLYEAALTLRRPHVPVVLDRMQLPDRYRGISLLDL